MIEQVLRRTNQELFDEASYLLAIVEKVETIAELRPYREWLANTLCNVQAASQDHLQLLSLGYAELLDDILSGTQQLTRTMSLCNSHLAGPLLRFHKRDKLSLRVLSWLHNTHPETRDIPFAISDGAFASWPWRPYPTIYFIPPTGQGSLRYQALFFHEFGHLLYMIYQAALDAEVGEFQRTVERLLEPRLVRDDPRAEAEARERAGIVETWYQWTQEFFCDAVGLQIGGPGFLHAFSAQMRLRGSGDFVMPPEQMRHSSHPSPWLRIRVLEQRAIACGFEEDACQIRTEWEAIGNRLGFARDYFGFYIEEFFEPLVHALDRMLAIVRPYSPASSDLGAEGCSAQNATPASLINSAWKAYRRGENGYRTQETAVVEEFLK